MLVQGQGKDKCLECLPLDPGGLASTLCRCVVVCREVKVGVGRGEIRAKREGRAACAPPPPPHCRLEGPSRSIPCKAIRDTAGWEHEEEGSKRK